MNALEVLEQWVEPLTGPLGDFLKETQILATTHQNSVTTFQNLVADLTDTQTPDAFVGDAATSMLELMGEYTTAEFALSGTAGALAGPIAEGGAACATAVASIGGGVATAASEAADAGPLLEVTAVVDVAAAAQGELDPVNDIAEVGLTAISAWWIVGVLITLGAALFGAWWIWNNAMNNIANQARPHLPKTPAVPVPPQALNAIQQQELDTLIQEFPDVSPDDIKALLLAGFTPDEIRAILKAGFSHAQIQDIIHRIKTAQQDQHGTDKLGLTVPQIHDLVMKVVAALNSPSVEIQLEGSVARTLIADVVSFQRKIYDANGTEVGEIDVETSTAIIEVTTEKGRKLPQLLKDQSDPFINPDGKEVILYAPNYSHHSDVPFADHDIPIARTLKELFDELRLLSGH